MVGCEESVEGDSTVMISVRGRTVVLTIYVGVVEIKEWYRGDFSAYICWLDCGF